MLGNTKVRDEKGKYHHYFCSKGGRNNACGALFPVGIPFDEQGNEVNSTVKGEIKKKILHVKVWMENYERGMDLLMETSSTYIVMSVVLCKWMGLVVEHLVQTLVGFCGNASRTVGNTMI